MDIPSMSVAQSAAKLQGDLGVAVLKKSLDTVESSGKSLIEMMQKSMKNQQAMERSVNPNLGGNIDIRL
ncbi:MAG: YjfB family protein [Lachnospiraceae bacterium]|nr:YjfB family protein [Lachnospiraceae bacterium]